MRKGCPSRPRSGLPHHRTSEQEASEAAPKIAALLDGIQTATMRADPNSLYNRVAKVEIPPVTGAPGDGNASLTKQIREHLKALGPVVQDSADGADFIVQGNVRMVPIGGGQQRVEIRWSVKRRMVMNVARSCSSTTFRPVRWITIGRTCAMIVATEAAGGINDVIARQSGRQPDEPVHGQQQKPLVEGRQTGRGRTGPMTLPGGQTL